MRPGTTTPENDGLGQRPSRLLGLGSPDNPSVNLYRQDAQSLIEPSNSAEKLLAVIAIFTVPWTSDGALPPPGSVW
jgi:hypothetical protein